MGGPRESRAVHPWTSMAVMAGWLDHRAGDRADQRGRASFGRASFGRVFPNPVYRRRIAGNRQVFLQRKPEFDALPGASIGVSIGRWVLGREEWEVVQEWDVV